MPAADYYEYCSPYSHSPRPTSTWISAVFSFISFSISLFVGLHCWNHSAKGAHKLQLKFARWSFSICFSFFPFTLASTAANETRKGIFRNFLSFPALEFYCRKFIAHFAGVSLFARCFVVRHKLTKLRGRIAWQWHGDWWFGILGWGFLVAECWSYLCNIWRCHSV